MGITNRPDCAYFLLLGLCGSAFLLTVGGILTYVAFNPGTLANGRAHSALSHIPHFHHHHAHSHHFPPGHSHPPPHPFHNANHNFTANHTAHPFNHTMIYHQNSNMTEAEFEAKAKQSLVLAIIGPLCIFVGIVIGMLVGLLALKYDCDKEPEPNISFLRLRSECSLNVEGLGEKNNYELLRGNASSSIEQAGGSYSINPTGLITEEMMS